MNSKYLMIASSVVMGLLGLAASFLPKELLTSVGISQNEALILLIQLGGALYIGFAMMNWMAKTVLIGGIYAKPLAMGNFVHFVIGALALLKGVMNDSISSYWWFIAIIYLLFAVFFGMVLFTSPVKKK